MMLASGWATRVDDLGRLVDLEEPEVGAAGDVEQDAPGALDGGLEQRADVMAARAALAARPSPMAEPMPMMAVPALVMIIFTSAKSVLIRPGTVIRLGDALHALQQDLVGHLEGVDHRSSCRSTRSAGGRWG